MIDQTFPLIDLHRHIEGAVRIETILDLGRKYHLPLPAWDVEGLKPHVQVMEKQPGVMAFIDKFEWAVRILVDYDACRRIAYENVADAFEEGLDYIELRFSPWFMAEPNRLDPGGVVEATIDGVEAAAQDTGIVVGVIGIISRTYGPELAWKELKAILSNHEHLKGLDLAGDEANFPGELFVEHIRQAQAVGLAVTIHAGEAAGPESVWQAVQGLGAQRLGHAVHASEDEALLDYLAEKRIGIESSLTSNVQTSTVSDYAAHPLRFFLERGILATINTDNPGISGIDLHYEYQVAAPAAGLNPGLIKTAQRNALEIAFLDEEEKMALLAKRLSKAP